MHSWYRASFIFHSPAPPMHVSVRPLRLLVYRYCLGCQLVAVHETVRNSRAMARMEMVDATNLVETDVRGLLSEALTAEVHLFDSPSACGPDAKSGQMS